MNMGYLKKSKETAAMARTRPDGKCKKHPKHKQSPGVCSVCLNEKLSQLSNSSSSTRTNSSFDFLSSSSSISSYGSSSCSTCASPLHHEKVGSSSSSSMAFLFSGKNILTKSRSLVFVTRTRNHKNGKVGDDDDGDDQSVNGKKKSSGFLSKLLLRSKNKRLEGGLMHSRTMRERVNMSSISTRV